MKKTVDMSSEAIMRRLRQTEMLRELALYVKKHVKIVPKPTAEEPKPIHEDSVQLHGQSSALSE